MKRWLALTFVCVISCVGAPLARHAGVRPSAKRYSVDRWTVEEGLPNNALITVMVSREGYLWTAGLAGAARFDGVRFTPILESLPIAHLRALLEDSAGNTWVGMVTAGLARISPGQTEIIPAARLAGSETRAIVEGSAGRVWVATEGGLSAVAAGQIRNYRREDGLPSDEVRALARGRTAANNVWIATDAGLCAVQGMSLRCGGPQTSGAAAIVEDRQGRVWAGGAAGLFSMRADFSPAFACASGCFPGRAVSVLRERAAGGLWIGFQDGGVTLWKEGEVEEYSTADGLVAGQVSAIAEDAEGSVWIAVYNGGLERLRPKRVTMYSTAEGLPVKVVGSIVQDVNGTIWAGSQCGPVSELRDGRFLPRFQEYTKNACAIAVWAARDGSLWIGSDQGLFRWYRNRMEHYGLAEGLSDIHVQSLREDRSGVLWIGTLRGGLHSFSNGRLSGPFGAADGVAVGELDNMAEDHEGRVWIGSNGNGLSVHENGHFRTLGAAEQPPERDISGLFVDSRDDLWVMTDRRGLFRRRHGAAPGSKQWDEFGVREGLGDKLVSLMLEDASGTLWASTAKGIVRLEREKIEAVAEGRASSLDPVTIDRTDGLLNPEVSGGGFDPTGLRDRDGRLWFSTIDGIAVIDPSQLRLNAREPGVIVESATVSGQPAPAVDGLLRVPAGDAPLEVRYTAFSFLVPRKVRFRYRLRDLEQDWQDAGDRRVAYYPHLPPGTYTFEVIAANNDGVWSSTPATLRITVAPLWWERRSVRALGLVLLLIATGLVVQNVSTRQARARLKQLEHQQALERERSRIAQDIHDDLGSRLTRMALLADTAAEEGAPETSAEVAEAAREAIQAMDELVWAVNTRNDRVDGFVSYAVAYAEEYLRAARIHVRVRTGVEALNGSGDAELGSEKRRELFLVFKEALNNVAKHSGASEVRVGFAVAATRGAREFIVSITDNGAGFDVARANSTGNGLRGMRNRIAAAGGRCDITSPSEGEAGGVHIHVSLPI